MNNNFTELTQSYLGICNILEHKIELIKKDSIFANDIIKCQFTINDLIIQLQNIKFKIDTIVFETENETEDNNQPSETDKFVDKTIKDMLPVIMLHMLKNDPNSIINKPTTQFSEQPITQPIAKEKNNTTLNADTISKMLSLANTLMNLPNTPILNETVSNSIDDVD